MTSGEWRQKYLRKATLWLDLVLLFDVFICSRGMNVGLGIQQVRFDIR